MPYLTPQDLPEADDCRPLSIPASSEWLALFGGALTELTLRWNWEYSGGLTVDETLDKMNEIIGNWYTVPCEACTTPGGYRVIRVNTDGHVEELNSDGEWQDSTGEYHIPPPDAREDGSPDDQICLAAKNAVNVLQQLYENLSDSYNTGLDDAEATTAFILGLIALVGFEFAPITWGIVAFMTPVFAALYSGLEFIFADLWDSSVSAQIVCFLKLCATNDAGVVTFDYKCFIRQLESLTDTHGLTEEQLRLYLQISYILYFIGGVDGLNLAGGTTAITDDDCADCNCEGTSVNFGASDFGFVQNAWDVYAASGTYMSNIFGTGIYADSVGGFNQIGVTGTVDEVCGNGINVNWTRGSTPPSAVMQVRVTTSTQQKTATIPLVGSTGSTSVLWDEGGELLPDAGTVDIGYKGTSGFGILFGSFHSRDIS